MKFPISTLLLIPLAASAPVVNPRLSFLKPSQASLPTSSYTCGTQTITPSQISAAMTQAAGFFNVFGQKIGQAGWPAIRTKKGRNYVYIIPVRTDGKLWEPKRGDVSADKQDYGVVFEVPMEGDLKFDGVVEKPFQEEGDQDNPRSLMKACTST